VNPRVAITLVAAAALSTEQRVPLRALCRNSWEVLARFLLWRLLGVLASFCAFSLTVWLLNGGLGRELGGVRPAGPHHLDHGWPRVGIHLIGSALLGGFSSVVHSCSGALRNAGIVFGLLWIAAATALLVVRWYSRRQRRYVRLEVEPYRTDQASAEAVVAMFDALHKRLLRRWWRRLVFGQPSFALEVHNEYDPRLAGATGADGAAGFAGAVLHRAWLAVSCPAGLEQMVQTALRCAYPNCRLRPARALLNTPPNVLRLKKQATFIKRVKSLDHFEHEREPSINRLLTVMGGCESSAFVQLALTPTPVLFEHYAKRLYRHHEARISRHRMEGLRPVRDRSMIDDSELRGGLDVQHASLFFGDLRVVGPDRLVCERIASELRAEGAENRLVERGTSIRHGLLGCYRRRVQRGEGNPLPACKRSVFAASELAAIWHLPSIDYATVPLVRTALPLAPAPPGVLRPAHGPGVLRDALGPVSIHPALRKQNTAVPGTVEQGKSSYLAASIAEDLLRERCAVIVFDPKGDAAEAAVSLVPESRICTLLDFAHPTCGFSPLAVDAPADVIADYAVAALKNLFTDADIRASSDRYLRNSIIAVLAYDRRSTLWDAARLLSVGEEGYSFRAKVGARIRTLPEFKEISEFFTAELTAQLADSRSTTTAKLDAPVNKLARLLNSASIKRVLLNDSLTIDFDRVIAEREVLVVKGALGTMGAGNTSVLMQLLMGMLDAALARQQDLLPVEQRISVALKVDEAPLVLNRGFAETMALKRSAGLETVACWQTNAQWVDREIRDQLDGLFAHRVYFATASARDARAAADLMMAEFSDTVRPGVTGLSSLAHPDVRLHLPKHHAIASWSTPEGRQAPFIAQTHPLTVDPLRLSFHAARQAERGGRYLADLRQPHWERRDSESRVEQDAPVQRRAPVEQPASAASVRHSAPVEQRALDEQPVSVQPPTPVEDLPSTDAAQPVADSFRELVDLDGAHTVRWAKLVDTPRSLSPDPLDLAILALVAALRHVLSSQIHRRFNPGRAPSTTQRRLKRLSDAGLLERFQFHRRDGGGVPMCYVLTAAGLELLDAHRRLARRGDGGYERAGPLRPPPTGRDSSAVASGERALRQARRDVHVAGWMLALEQTLGVRAKAMLGAADAVISPRSNSAASPSDLRLPEGRVAHEFLQTDEAGVRVELQRFQTVRPDVAVELDLRVDGAGRAIGADVLLVEYDDRPATGRSAAKLERYDHLVSGWWSCAGGGPRLRMPPLVLFVCRSRSRARACATSADPILTACHAYAGEYPVEWRYPGRQRILYVAERDIHEGLTRAYGVPPLPPEVRVTAAHGDPLARAPRAERRDLLVVQSG
jgi:Replication-relaxation